jgi:hypothetical protein
MPDSTHQFDRLNLEFQRVPRHFDLSHFRSHLQGYVADYGIYHPEESLVCSCRPFVCTVFA